MQVGLATPGLFLAEYSHIGLLTYYMLCITSNECQVKSHEKKGGWKNAEAITSRQMQYNHETRQDSRGETYVSRHAPLYLVFVGHSYYRPSLLIKPVSLSSRL